MVALAAAVSALVHITLGRAFKSVGHILRGMEDIEQGDYGKRLPRFGLPEFDRISAAFNHMAQALAKSRDENRALTRHSLRVQEEERRYLAQELHDELGQSLSAIKAMAASLRNVGDGGVKANGPQQDVGEAGVEDKPAAVMEPAQTIMDQCDRLFAVVRGMMRRLRPLMLDELGLIPCMQDMIENWRTRHPDIDIRSALDNDVEEFAGSAKIHLFRIVQESLTNVSKHAKAKNVRIELGLMENDRIRLAVADDGKGFDPALPRNGFGLHGIHERVASMDGVLTLQASPGGGVGLEIKIPCDTIKP
jgi:two-component system sensor histidine kinase UhpB